jgi:Spy/CpxP family protein refolding chaperone
MKNCKVVLGILLVFALGAASGFAATRLIYLPRMEAAMGGPGRHEEALVNRLSRRLGLNDQQRQQVRSIVHETHTEVKLVRRQCQPQVEAVLAKGQAKINGILAPQQREEYARIIAERQARQARDN